MHEPSAADPPPALIERMVARDRLIVLACLAAVVGLAWLWLLRAAGAMDMHDMASMAPMPQVWSAAYLLPALLMWSLMMVAMMLPSAAPMILLHARFARGSGQPRVLIATGLFLLAYVALWLAFSLAATLLQAALVASGAVSEAALALGDARIAGLALILAGGWQLTPLKRACLGRCRSPASFLTQFWRPGAAGAVRLGLLHGLYCIGCCWALMLLLFVGGVMSLAWIGGLALIVLAEKLAPAWLPVRAATGVAMLVTGVVLALGWEARACFESVDQGSAREIRRDKVSANTRDRRQG